VAPPAGTVVTLNEGAGATPGALNGSSVELVEAPGSLVAGADSEESGPAAPGFGVNLAVG